MNPKADSQTLDTIRKALADYVAAIEDSQRGRVARGESYT